MRIRSRQRFLRQSPVALTLAFFVSSCSSSTDSTPSPVTLTHPAGVIDAIDSLVPGAHGLGISKTGAIVVTRYDSADVVVSPTTGLSFGIGIPVGPLPLDVALTPDGTRAFIPLTGNSRVAIIDVTTGAHSDDITTVLGPQRALVTPDGSRVYFTTEGDDGEGGTGNGAVYAFDARTLALIDTIVIRGNNNGIAYDASTSRLYVSSRVASAVYEIDATADTVIRAIPVADAPQDLAITRDHRELWVATEGETGVQVYHLPSGHFYASIPETSGAFGLAISPDGYQVYATRITKGKVAIIDRFSFDVVGLVDSLSTPTRVAFDATGEHAFITDPVKGVVRVK